MNTLAFPDRVRYGRTNTNSDDLDGMAPADDGFWAKNSDFQAAVSLLEEVYGALGCLLMTKMRPGHPYYDVLKRANEFLYPKPVVKTPCEVFSDEDECFISDLNLEIDKKS